MAAIAGLVVAGCSSGEQRQIDGQTRTVVHAMGSSEVPTQPERVVVLDTVLLDAVVALDVIPVGAALVVGENGLPAYLGDRVDSVTPVGEIMEPSLEQITALDPDLILSAKSRHGDLYDTLDAIAPTVFIENAGDDWRGSVQLVGEALGLADRAEQVLADYDTRAEELRDELAVDGQTVQVIRARDDGTVRLYGPDTFVGDVLTQVGLSIPAQQWDDSGIIEVSSEFAGEIGADHVLITTATATPALPGWVDEILADTADNVTTIDQGAWVAGVGPLGANAILDDLPRAVGA